MAETATSKIIRLETQMQNISTEVSEIKAGVASLIVKVDGLIIAHTEITTLRNEVKGLKEDITALKGINSLKNTLLWVGLVASAIINVVVIYQLFAGH